MEEGGEEVRGTLVPASQSHRARQEPGASQGQRSVGGGALQACVWESERWPQADAGTRSYRVQTQCVRVCSSGMRLGVW